MGVEDALRLIKLLLREPHTFFVFIEVVRGVRTRRVKYFRTPRLRGSEDSKVICRRFTESDRPFRGNGAEGTKEASVQSSLLCTQ